MIKREKICDNCKDLKEDFEENFTLEDFLDSLSEEEQRDALVHLSLKWVENRMLVYRLRLPKEMIISWYSKSLDISNSLDILVAERTAIVRKRKSQ